ncbi:aldo/keto reductase [Tsuneonella sp. YG55]|uniref:Aldo/keto reductase n=1 Tax=Tsuneonella litorea TaxID=2976475 RepID=A0A9X2W279_9SPHN|nr:aldo/keto reductase [Tsuneonella litorea]MCT2558610.1 aldo/keto reductase [Tsuneonella litorea]
MSKTPAIPLNDGRTIPQLGFGTWQIPDETAADAVSTAIAVGYELVDTAAIYQNERGVGKGLADNPDTWLTTKIWNESQGYDRALRAMDKCLERLGRDSVDLVLIHWPCPARGLAVETWKALVAVRDAGKAKSIGVSNFREQDLKTVIDATGVVPALNQVELHPAFQQRELRDVHEKLGIVTQSWSPLGQGGAMTNPVITGIARECDRPASAVILRWHLQSGLCTIPKATGRAHIEANFEALDFALSDDQMARIDALDEAGGRIGPDPADFG